ncbi:RRM domain-containing protein [Psidium guajava]|nr:RRM domain-containing protein [Psidium guajava]
MDSPSDVLLNAFCFWVSELRCDDILSMNGSSLWSSTFSGCPVSVNAAGLSSSRLISI